MAADAKSQNYDYSNHYRSIATTSFSLTQETPPLDRVDIRFRRRVRSALKNHAKHLFTYVRPYEAMLYIIINLLDIHVEKSRNTVDAILVRPVLRAQAR